MFGIRENPDYGAGRRPVREDGETSKLEDLGNLFFGVNETALMQLERSQRESLLAITITFMTKIPDISSMTDGRI